MFCPPFVPENLALLGGFDTLGTQRVWEILQSPQFHKGFPGGTLITQAGVFAKKQGAFNCIFTKLYLFEGSSPLEKDCIDFPNEKKPGILGRTAKFLPLLETVFRGRVITPLWGKHPKKVFGVTNPISWGKEIFPILFSNCGRTHSKHRSVWGRPSQEFSHRLVCWGLNVSNVGQRVYLSTTPFYNLGQGVFNTPTKTGGKHTCVIGCVCFPRLGLKRGKFTNELEVGVFQPHCEEFFSPWKRSTQRETAAVVIFTTQCFGVTPDIGYDKKTTPFFQQTHVPREQNTPNASIF